MRCPILTALIAYINALFPKFETNLSRYLATLSNTSTPLSKTNAPLSKTNTLLSKTNTLFSRLVWPYLVAGTYSIFPCLSSSALTPATETLTWPFGAHPITLKAVTNAIFEAPPARSGQASP